jgi:hypothetical protein
MKINRLILLSCILINSCQSEFNYDLKGYTQKIIVEGYISTNDYAKVYLSLNIPLSQKFDSLQMIKNFISVAKVSISDGVNTEILTGGYVDKKHYPPFYYATTDLKGKEGSTYNLTIEYAGYTLRSTTTIPYSDSVNYFTSTAINDSMRSLKMNINVNSINKGSYKVYTQKSIDNKYYPTPFLFNPNLTQSGPVEYVINPKPAENAKSFKQSNLFKKDDEVKIQVNKIDSIATAFFRGISIGSNNGLGSDIFIGQKDALISNISSPGFGIWYGRATKTYSVKIK